jgi:alpha-mannosidase
MMIIPWKTNQEKNYETQFPINPVLKNEIKKSIRKSRRKKIQINPSWHKSWDLDEFIENKSKKLWNLISNISNIEIEKKKLNI